jgi:hypothetical protein
MTIDLLRALVTLLKQAKFEVSAEGAGKITAILQAAEQYIVELEKALVAAEVPEDDEEKVTQD